MSLNSFVWLKQEGYPWWPGIVVDPAVAGQTMPPELGDTGICVLCLPSAASTIAFANRDNPEEVLPFRGGEDETDEGELARRREGLSHPDCAAAVEEALGKFQAAEKTVGGSHSLEENQAAGERVEHRKKPKEGKKKRHDEQQEEDDDMALLHIEKTAMPDKSNEGAHHDSEDDDDDDDDEEDEDEEEEDLHNVLDAVDENRKRRSVARDTEKQRKREEKRRQRKEEKKQKRKRSRHEEEEEGGGERHRRGDAAVKKSSRSSRRQKSAAAPREEEGKELWSDGDQEEKVVDDSAEEAQRFFATKYRTRRHPATDEELLRYADQVSSCIASLHEDESHSMGEEGAVDEQALLEILRHFAVCDVTAEQLQKTNVGKTVGYLLKLIFPTRVRILANAILTYWFTSLSQSVQEALMDTDVGNCSIESTQGSQDPEVDRFIHLPTMAIQIFWYFQEDEITEWTSADDEFYQLCERLATAIQGSENTDVRLAVLHRIENEAPLRIQLLQGDIEPNQLIQQEEEGLKGFGSPLIRRDGSPTSPMDMGSPNTFGPSTLSQSAVLTTLHACPSCGATDAYRSGYSVSAHDNFPDILLCRRCGERWNISA